MKANLELCLKRIHTVARFKVPIPMRVLAKLAKLIFERKIGPEFDPHFRPGSNILTVFIGLPQMTDQTVILFSPYQRKKQLLRRIKKLGLTMAPLKSRTKILNVEKEHLRIVYLIIIDCRFINLHRIS